MPWAPELFSAPALQRVLDRRRREALAAVPYFDGLLAGEPEALLGSFVDEPEIHDPVRGRIKGGEAFAPFIVEMNAWLLGHRVEAEDVAHVVLDGHGFEEVLLHVHDDDQQLEVPFAVVADRAADGRIHELRIYASWWPLTGSRPSRLPVMQPDPKLRVAGVIDDYQRAVAAGDPDAVASVFEADGHVRDAANRRHVGRAAVAAFYERHFRDEGAVTRESCAVIDDGHTCAWEYNTVGPDPLDARAAGFAVLVRAPSGRLAEAHLYDVVGSG